MRPKVSSVTSTARSTAARSATSTPARVWTRLAAPEYPQSSISATIRSRISWSCATPRDTSMTRAPALARRRPIWPPIPAEPPVTSATFPRWSPVRLSIQVIEARFAPVASTIEDGT